MLLIAYKHMNTNTFPDYFCGADLNSCVHIGNPLEPENAEGADVHLEDPVCPNAMEYVSSYRRAIQGTLSRAHIAVCRTVSRNGLIL